MGYANSQKVWLLELDILRKANGVLRLVPLRFSKSNYLIFLRGKMFSVFAGKIIFSLELFSKISKKMFDDIFTYVYLFFFNNKILPTNRNIFFKNTIWRYILSWNINSIQKSFPFLFSHWRLIIVLDEDNSIFSRVGFFLSRGEILESGLNGIQD